MNGYGLLKDVLPVKGPKHAGLPGEAEFPVSPHTAKSRHYLQHPFSVLSPWGCWRGGSPDTPLWQLSHGQDTPPARKCGFHRAHQALRSLPGFCLGLPGSPHPPVGQRYFGVTAHVYNPALSGYVVVTFLKSFCGSNFSLGNPGQMAEILTFWQDKNSS